MNSRKNWTSMFKSKASTSGNQLHETTDSSAMRTPYPEGVSSTNYEQERERSSPKAKSRWNPKPEQIQILENIYKSGMVIPPREEIKRIRVKLEEFGHLEDVNVFYWFQNKKSRTKLKQRRLQAAQRSKSNTETGSPSSCSSTSPSKPIMDLTNNLVNTILNNNGNQPNSSYAVSVSSFAEHHSDLRVNEEMSNNQRSIVQAAAIWNKGGDVQSSINANPIITVFINDIPVELPAGPINFKALFGDDALLLHSSGHCVLMDEWGFTLEGLEPGALYFLM